jgi:hypothetical protein
MIELALALGAAGAYLAGYPGVAFWIVALAILYGAVHAMNAVLYPEWYAMEKMDAGPRPTIAPGILIVIKLVFVGIFAMAGWSLGQSLGYF